MGVLARLLRIVWARWADYNSFVAILELLDWKTGLFGLFGGLVMMVFGADIWSPNGIVLVGLAAGGCISLIVIAFRMIAIGRHSRSASPAALSVLLNRFTETERNIVRLTTALRARDAESKIKESDQVIMSTYEKLLEGAYPDEATWAADYAMWEAAVKRIDGIMSEWSTQPHKPLIDLKDLELGAPPPPLQSNIRSDANVMRYKTAWHGQGNYANRRDCIFIFFASKAGELPG